MPKKPNKRSREAFDYGYERRQYRKAVKEWIDETSPVPTVDWATPVNLSSSGDRRPFNYRASKQNDRHRLEDLIEPLGEKEFEEQMEVPWKRKKKASK